MGLFGPAWESGNKDKAVKAVAKIEDQKTLAQVVSTLPTFCGNCKKQLT